MLHFFVLIFTQRCISTSFLSPLGCRRFPLPPVLSIPPPPHPFAHHPPSGSKPQCSIARVLEAHYSGSLSRDKWLFCDNRMSLIKLVINRITRWGVCRPLTETYTCRPSIKNSCLGCNSYVSEATNNKHSTSPLLFVNCESFQIQLKYLLLGTSKNYNYWLTVSFHKSFPFDEIRCSNV